MRDELATILRLVSEGTLSPDEAAPIIEALSRAPGGGTTPGSEPDDRPERGAFPPPPPPPAAPAASSGSGTRAQGDARQMRIRVTERGRQVVNLRIPVAFADMALRMVPGISADQGERIRAAIAGHAMGPILDVEDEDGDGVLITVE